MAGNDNTIFLHGDLDLKILEVEPSRKRGRPQQPDNPNQDCSHELQVVVPLAGIKVAQIHIVSDPPNPVWNQHLKIPLAHSISQIEFHVKDEKLLKSKLICVATVPVEKIAAGELIDEWTERWPAGTVNRIHFQITFNPCEQNPIYLSGISENYGLKESYFPLRKGGKVTLYQDAHVSDETLPKIELDEGRNFEHQKCWEDLCHAILDARHLVYISGWSIYHKIRLMRESTKTLPNGTDLNLGELLKCKARNGVRVLVLVWNDKTGLMQTHDKETLEFFKRSFVKCLLTPCLSQQVRRAFYSQHQKCVIVDTQGDDNNRKITAFIGGLDLCDGRYDTPEHRLFRDRNTVFKDDFHNPTFRSKVNGPRQPWHDLHCKLEGPAAYDVLMNFKQRWEEASVGFERTVDCYDNSLLDVENIPWIISPTETIPNDDPSLWVYKEDDPENWHIQVFRSIDSRSLKGFPKDIHEAMAQNLACEKKLVIDKSIERAYIQAIRSAQHFIYVENQYFLGSSYAWTSNKDAGANNLIPMELALKIANKIKANERFTVYIVIPMWPEGDPSSILVQEILYWQRQTMQMMYKIVAQAIKSAKLKNVHPTDYLNFYCLGNREKFHEEEADGPTSPHGNRDSASKGFGRFMIYVHSKGMIVDDEYVILGSANINQRSMAGSRDTEIAMGAYQPYYTWNKKKGYPYGQVYGYRMSLWAEHIGSVVNCLKYPENIDCVKYVNDIAENNWKQYIAEKFILLQGHILKYPIEIDINGQVNPLPGYEKFPDAGGEVRGAQTIMLPYKLTT